MVSCNGFVQRCDVNDGKASCVVRTSCHTRVRRSDSAAWHSRVYAAAQLMMMMMDDGWWMMDDGWWMMVMMVMQVWSGAQWDWPSTTTRSLSLTGGRWMKSSAASCSVISTRRRHHHHPHPHRLSLIVLTMWSSIHSCRLCRSMNEFRQASCPSLTTTGQSANVYLLTCFTSNQSWLLYTARHLSKLYKL